jgi:hypothetical protein
MKNKTAAPWFMFIIPIIMVLVSLIASLAFYPGNPEYKNRLVHDVILFASSLIEIGIFSIYISKLAHIRKDIVIWTDIVFGYDILRRFLSVAMTNLWGAWLTGAIEILIVIAIWVLYLQTLKPYRDSVEIV